MKFLTGVLFFVLGGPLLIGGAWGLLFGANDAAGLALVILGAGVVLSAPFLYLHREAIFPKRTGPMDLRR